MCTLSADDQSIPDENYATTCWNDLYALLDFLYRSAYPCTNSQTCEVFLSRIGRSPLYQVEGRRGKALGIGRTGKKRYDSCWIMARHLPDARLLGKTELQGADWDWPRHPSAE
jgi:hypothetical protein